MVDSHKCSYGVAIHLGCKTTGPKWSKDNPDRIIGETCKDSSSGEQDEGQREHVGRPPV